MMDIKEVSFYRDFEVLNGEVVITDNDYEQFLTDIYGTIEVCGMVYDAGQVLRETDPTAFRCGKADYQAEVQAELVECLENEDYSLITFF